METENINYNFIDIMKFFFMLCVIAIHSHIEVLFGRAGWYVTHCVFRLAVPFFFVASGFFFKLSLEKSGGGLEETVKKYVKRILIPFVFYVVLNISLDVFLKIINNYDFSIKWILRTFQKVLFDPPGAMWFLSACIFGILFLYPFLKKQKLNTALFIGFFLYLFAMACNTYFYVVKDNNFISNLINLYIKFFKVTRNGLFVGFFYLALGIKCYEITKKQNLNCKTLCFVISVLFLFLVTESFFAEKNKQFLMDDSSLFISLPFLAACIFLLSLQISWPQKNTTILRNLSSGMYFMHRFVLSVVSIGLVHLCPAYKDSSPLKFLLTTFLSFFICMVGYKINNKKLNYLIK